jgi:hypothetical protein
MTRIADEWWALDFGCDPDELRPERVRVQAHKARLSGTPGIWMLVSGGAPVISMPLDVFKTLGERAEAWTAALISDETRLLQELSGLAPGRVGKVIGPATISYGSAASLDLRDAARALLVPAEASIAELKAACGEDWNDGGSEPAGQPLSASPNMGSPSTFGCEQSSAVATSLLISDLPASGKTPRARQHELA